MSQARCRSGPGEPKQPALEPLSSAGIGGMLEHVQDNPLGNKPSGGKTSLAGVQDRIVQGRVSLAGSSPLSGCCCRALWNGGQYAQASEP